MVLIGSIGIGGIFNSSQSIIAIRCFVFCYDIAFLFFNLFVCFFVNVRELCEFRFFLIMRNEMGSRIRKTTLTRMN